MLETIEVNRFKSILNQKIEFGAVNLFVGGNGSGKSNLLEAIGFASAALARGISDDDLAAKGVRLSTPAFFKSAFKGKRLPKTFRIEATFSNDIHYHFELLGSEVESHLRFNTEKAMVHSDVAFGRSGKGATVQSASLPQKPTIFRGMYDQVRPAFQLNPDLIAAFDEFAKYAIYAPQTEFLRGSEIGTIKSPPLGLHGEGLPQAAATIVAHWGNLLRKTNSKNKTPSDTLEYEFLNGLFDLIWSTGWTDQFRVGHIDPMIMSSQIKTGDNTLFFRDKFMHTKRNTVTAYDSSEGVLFLLFLVILIGHPDSPKTFSLDNVDNALNPRMTKIAVKHIIKATTDPKHKRIGLGPSQVFMTSHNPTAMDAFDIFNDSTRIFVAKRNELGHTEFKRLEPPKNTSREKWIKLKDGRSLSELWIEGKINGALGAEL